MQFFILWQNNGEACEYLFPTYKQPYSEIYFICIVRKRIITKPILILSLVSMFTDISSEMLYPVMPLFLKSIGFSVLLIGILEGLAELTAGLSKGYFGQLSDRKRKRVIFVRGGYTLSALSKPMMAVVAAPLWIFFARTLDRLGKGVRTGARDAMLSDLTTPGHKAKVFGFHRALDTAGAFVGPLLALGFLFYYPGRYNPLFIFALIPGMLSIGLTFLLRDPVHAVVGDAPPRPSFFGFVRYLRSAPLLYRKLVAGLLIFAIFNSSDVFLLLVMKNAGVSDLQLIGAYVFYNAVYALFAYPAGILADRAGKKTMLVAGLIIFAAVYAGFGFASAWWQFALLLFFYGIYAACTESVAKAWITNIVPASETASAIGAFTAVGSVCAMIASSMAGLVWMLGGASAVMLMSAVAVAGVAVYFIILVPQNAK